MTSYNQFSPDSQPINAQHTDTPPIRRENLALVRRGLTSRPQNSLADFKIRATSYSLEIQFYQQRLRDCPAFDNRKRDSAEPELSPVMIAATILLVGGSVALTQSTIFGVLVAIAIPTFWKLSTPAKEPSQYRTATLRFVNTPKQQTVLSLTTSPASLTTNSQGKQIQRYLEPTRDRETIIHFSNLPVQLVSANTYIIGGQLNLTLYASDAKGKNKLQITGTRQEIEWLHSRIDQWARETAPQQSP